MTLPCKLSKQNLADMLQEHQKSDGEFLCKHRNFPANNMIDKKYFLTFLILNQELKITRNDSRKVDGKGKSFGVYESSKEGLLFESSSK
jgi:hypothetical protein